MSEVTRYDHIVPEYHRPDEVMFEDKDGDYVLYDDHARLVALVKALPPPDGELWVAYRDGKFEVRDKLSMVLGPFVQEEVAEAYKALLTARKEMGG